MARDLGRAGLLLAFGLVATYCIWKLERRPRPSESEHEAGTRVGLLLTHWVLFVLAACTAISTLTYHGYWYLAAPLTIGSLLAAYAAARWWLIPRALRAARDLRSNWRAGKYTTR